MKGLMYEWIGVVLGLFVVGLLFITFNQAYVSGIQDYGSDNIRINDSFLPDQVARNTWTILDSMWTYLPALFIFLALLYMLIRAQERTPPFG